MKGERQKKRDADDDVYRHRTPKPFKCDIRPRSAAAVRAVMEAAEALGV